MSKMESIMALNASEDSVDIYEDLDVGVGSRAEAWSPVSSQLKELRESMDLYEDVVTEEQQSREAVNTELKFRFQTSQNEIKELHRKLEQMEKQNTGLRSENFCLKKNISALLRTARQELLRKDAEIQRLNQRTDRGHHHHRSHNNVHDPVSPSHTSISKVPPPPTCSLPPPRLVSPSRDVHLPQGPSQLPKMERCSLTRTSSPPKRSRSNADVDNRRTESHKSGEKPESTERTHREASDPNKNLHLPKKTRSHRAEKDSGQRLCRLGSEGAKTSSQETSDKKRGHRQSRLDKVIVSSLEHEKDRWQSLKEGRDHQKTRKSHTHDSRSHSWDRKKSSSHHAERCRDFLKHKDGQTTNQRKGDKGRKDESSSKHKKSQSGEKRRGETPKNKESENRKVEVRSEVLQKNMPKAAKVPPEGNLDENSPNRKLCFMETLHLTVSPIKKPALPPEHVPDDDHSHLDLEDLCVIDEVDNSELDSPTQRSPQSLQASNEGSQVTPDCQKDCQEPLSQTDCSVQRNQDGSRPLGAASDVTGSPEDKAAPVAERRTWKVADASDSCRKISSEPKTKPDLPVPVLRSDQETCPDSARETVVLSNPEEDPPQDIHEDIRPQTPHIPPTLPLPVHPQEPSPLSSTTFTSEKGEPGDPEDLEAVSSTISLESLPQEGLSLMEAINVLAGNDSDTAEPISSTCCIAVSKVSSTTEENKPILTVTPRKSFGSGASRVGSTEPSSSVPLQHDEDSMMRTLSSLRRIPDAISPLRSPVRVTKRSLLHVHGKPGHVKSLQKEFICSAADASSKKLDVNKENKSPGPPANQETHNLPDNVSDQPPVHSVTDLEEGEILSESDDAASTSPAPVRKRAKPVKEKQSPAPLLKRKPEERHGSSKEGVAVSTQSPRSRFKTVCPSVSKAAFSTLEEIMETFRLVRSQIRKKYMKLHKTFPKKSFYGVMDNFHKSFVEFVDGAYFGQICSRTDELKSQLKKLISSLFNKILNNGIVKRIFEQQAVDLKQKLWDFVDIQVDYLFKDIQATLKSFCKPVRDQVRDKMSPQSQQESPQPPEKKPQLKQKNNSPPTSLNLPKSCSMGSYRTGLGSRGKDIRITVTDPHPTDPQKPQTPVEKNLPSVPGKVSSLVVSQTSTMLDKTDFQLLTEQQASSLTFNLVRDSQMGEIFKCLLQGSDLLDGSGDSPIWSLGTQHKDGERLIGISTPSKFDSPSKLLSPSSPSKLLATWSPISPRKTLSPHPKAQIPLNPALFDENCLLEVPSENRAVLHAGLISQKTYSILAEDLAVSLTIPSPLKSDSHLSFLQPSSTSMHIVSTPDSVISAHISEDAQLDGEDAPEQEFHLALDTDNSSCGSSSSSMASAAPHASFLFKPDLPMQAVVMEKSNDHFVVRIRQASTDVTLTADESFSQTLTENNDSAAHDIPPGCQRDDPTGPSHTGSETYWASQNQHHPSYKDPSNGFSPKDLQESASLDDGVGTSFLHCASHADSGGHEEDTSLSKIPVPQPESVPQQHQAPLRPSSESEEVGMSESERSLIIAEDTGSSPDKTQRDHHKGRKRKKLQEKLQTKKSRKEPAEGKSSSSCPAALSPSSLSARNVVRKKGEVVVAWTRDEDRTILMQLKTMGASRETFSALSEKLHKPSGQIAHRFYQLMKLFKKHEDT